MFLDLTPGNLIEPLTGRRWTPGRPRTCAWKPASARYAAAGLARGDRAFIHFGNCHEFFAELLAMWRLGACAIPIDPRFTPFEIETLAAWSRPKFSSWMDAPDGALLSRAGRTRCARNRGSKAIVPPLHGGVRRAGSLSTTTRSFSSPREPPGSPRVSCTRTGRCARAGWRCAITSGLDAYARTLCTLPTHFGHGLICNCLFPWLSGCDLYIMPPFRPEITARIGAIIDEHRITFMSSVPALWRLALRIAKPPQLHSLRECLSARRRFPPRSGATSRSGPAAHAS